MIKRISSSTGPWPLFNAGSSRRLEQAALAKAAPHALMAAAGLSVARLALAIAPHSRTMWIAAGPGNNGGDGLVAARHLLQAGKQVVVSLLGRPEKLPADARHALQQAQQAGVTIEASLPTRTDHELAIDALLGLGVSRAPSGDIAEAIAMLNRSNPSVLAVDLPSGLSGDTGVPCGVAVRATQTLALLSLKPGLFTAQGRDHAGSIWFDALDVDPTIAEPDACLPGPPNWPVRQHAQHKGSFGDVVVIGGAQGMSGAATLAATAALTAGAGRVYLASLAGDEPQLQARPELMPRSVAQVLAPLVLRSSTVVCGCGGGEAVRAGLPAVLADAARLVLDADALNAIAADPALQDQLRQRSDRGAPTVLTPHPLEAARLLHVSTAEVQADRIAAAHKLSRQLQAGVVLKGSGSVVAFVDSVPWINPTGNARLGTAGSGDVLAGWLGGLWAQQPDTNGSHAAQAATWLHGLAAEAGDPRLPLRAADLIEQMASTLARL